jgi:hypothetical protein
MLRPASFGWVFHILSVVYVTIAFCAVLFAAAAVVHGKALMYIV